MSMLSAPVPPLASPAPSSVSRRVAGRMSEPAPAQYPAATVASTTAVISGLVSSTKAGVAERPRSATGQAPQRQHGGEGPEQSAGGQVHRRQRRRQVMPDRQHAHGELRDQDR